MRLLGLFAFSGLLALLTHPEQGVQHRRTAEPMLIDMSGNGFSLTSPSDGALVDMDGDQIADRTAWTVRDGDDAFVCVDENENGVIDVPSELVGGTSGPPIGFALLAAMDGVSSRGRPEAIPDRRPDGRLDRRDALYDRLILWTDRNHNGHSEEDEMEGLAHAGIIEIATGFEGIFRPDGAGNTFQYTAQALRLNARGVKVSREVITVRLAQ